MNAPTRYLISHKRATINGYPQRQNKNKRMPQETKDNEKYDSLLHNKNEKKKLNY